MIIHYMYYAVLFVYDSTVYCKLYKGAGAFRTRLARFSSLRKDSLELIAGFR